VVTKRSLPVEEMKFRREMEPLAAVNPFETERLVEETFVNVADADEIFPAMRDPIVAVFAVKEEPEAVTKVRFVEETFWSVEELAMSDPMIPLFA